ncbi:hypothetical protein SLEP1_g37229 [Rubroshorea leprosula]|uniref:Uncharacterized protein n=1 Tax=Rubroshorea leprosula TaxID=152421 RepID=A0AAV5KU67_9ROSI|nr:hypothetical protein SLEP1_g37229 [Rubroshorea leprosula]
MVYRSRRCIAATAKDVGAMMSCIRLTVFSLSVRPGNMVTIWGSSTLSVRQSVGDNIDELDVAFSNNSRLLFNEKDKDVEVNSRPNHLLDDSIGQNNPINIEHNGGSHADEGPKEGGMDQIKKGDNLMPGPINGKNRKRGGSGGGQWKRLDRNLENSSNKDSDKHGKRKPKTTLVDKERALKALVDNSRVAVI